LPLRGKISLSFGGGDRMPYAAFDIEFHFGPGCPKSGSREGSLGHRGAQRP
jgi:hypothetical protein